MQIAEQILRLLKASGQTVSVAESITAGHVQSLLASVSGASDVFKGGLTAYQRAVKVEQLGVTDELAKKTDCVDEEIARQMAQGSLKMFHSTYALATCGYAERYDGEPYAYYAIIREPDKLLASARIKLSGNRLKAQQQAARMVMEKFRDLLVADEAGNQ